MHLSQRVKHLIDSQIIDNNRQDVPEVTAVKGIHQFRTRTLDHIFVFIPSLYERWRNLKLCGGLELLPRIRRGGHILSGNGWVRQDHGPAA